MVRQIIKIDADICNGCGLCADACHEGAIGMVDGKARLLRDDYCDGLGNCLPVCPTGAISFEQREAAPFDVAAVQANMQAVTACDCAGDASASDETLACGCPGTQVQTIDRGEATSACGCADDESGAPAAGEPLACGCSGTHVKTIARDEATSASAAEASCDSRLRQWPVQLQLVPANAPYFKNAHLLVAADCTAYAYGNFHNDFIAGRIALIGCPKLDAADYAAKLTDILRNNDIQSVTVVRMEVPCCGGLAQAVIDALRASGKVIPWQIVTIGTDGNRTKQ